MVTAGQAPSEVIRIEMSGSEHVIGRPTRGGTLAKDKNTHIDVNAHVVANIDKYE